MEFSNIEMYDSDADIIYKIYSSKINTSYSGVGGPAFHQKNEICVTMNMSYMNDIKNMFNTSKRTFFILQKDIVRLNGCFPIEMNCGEFNEYSENYIEVTFSCDYMEIGNEFQEITSLIRNKKINILLD